MPQILAESKSEPLKHVEDFPVRQLAAECQKIKALNIYQCFSCLPTYNLQVSQDSAF
jgi:hypothetical protein